VFGSKRRKESLVRGGSSDVCSSDLRKAARFAPLDIGLAGALVAFYLACEWARTPAVFGVFTAAAGGVLVVAMLQESYRLAFHDEIGRASCRERADGSWVTLSWKTRA